MRFAVQLKTLSFGLALITCFAAGAASAQTLLGVNARLDHALDSKTAATGQVVTAKLDGSVTTPDGLRLPRGTELVGKVDEVKASEKGGPASVSLVFASAKLKDGKSVPVKATLVAAFPSDEGDTASFSQQTIPAPPEQIQANTSIHQDAGALGKVSLVSAVKSSDSGTFSRTDGNFHLSSGTCLQFGIAGNGGSATAAAE